MKDLEGRRISLQLGWKFSDQFGYWKSFECGVRPFRYMVSIHEWTDGKWGVWVSGINSDERISLPFDTLDQAVAFANSAACVTPDNPKGRWVE